MLDDRRTHLEACADHLTTGAFAVGEGRRDWRDFDFAAMRVTLRSKNRVYAEGRGGHAFSDPFLPCVVLVNERRRAEGLRAGQLLVTGSFTGFFEVEPDETVVAEFEGFGSAFCTMVSHEARRSPDR